MEKSNIVIQNNFLKKIDYKKVFYSLLPVFGIIVGILLGSIVIIIRGVNPIDAYKALFNGALGSMDSFTGSLVKTIPLGITGLAVILSNTSGIFNIGAEGQLQLGAVAATFVGVNFIGHGPILTVVVCILSAALVGGLLALIPGILKAYKGYNEIIITMLLNYIAVLFVSYLVRGPLKQPDQTFPQSAELLSNAKLPILIPHTQLHWGIILLLAASFIIYFIKYRTSFGYKMRAVGLNKNSSDYAGIDSKKVMVLAMMLSGAIAGIAGGVEIMGVQGRLMDNFSPGYGYDAIAVAILANLNPIWMLLSAFFFGALSNGAISMQIITGVPVYFVSIIQAFAVLFVVAFTGLPRYLKRVRRNR